MRMRMSDDLRTPIEPLANPDVQTPGAWMSPGNRHKAFSILERGCKGKAGRAPGTLTNAKRAGAVQSVENGADIAAGKTRAALSWGKIIAEASLQFLDCGAEARQVLLGNCRQRLHQDQAADVGSIRVEHWRKCCEGGHFVWSMYAATLRIVNSKNAPSIRKRQVADDWCRRWFMTAAAVDDQTPARKKSYADARAFSAPQMQRIAFDIEGPIMEPA